MSLRREFVALAASEGANVRELCRRFAVAPKTGYKWIGRFESEGPDGLRDRSRRPHSSPLRTPPGIEREVLAVRDEHPAWGGRKIRARLRALGLDRSLASSTITGILHRHGRIHPAESAGHTPWRRFEHGAPNDLWQMDFKGHFQTMRGRCHPLGVLDDHSRYSVCLAACADERLKTVSSRLTGTFRRHGLPWWMLMDNGSPWGNDAESRHTRLTVWLMRLGIGVSHSRPYHPQTQGNEERFHRTLKAEVISGRAFGGLDECQEVFDRWLCVYNHERPHEALGMDVPSSRYTPSPRAFPETLRPIEYAPGDEVRKVQQGGWIWYKGRDYRVGAAFRGQPVALRPTDEDGVLEVYFRSFAVAEIDLRDHNQER